MTHGRQKLLFRFYGSFGQPHRVFGIVLRRLCDVGGHFGNDDGFVKFLFNSLLLRDVARHHYDSQYIALKILIYRAIEQHIGQFVVHHGQWIV